MASGESLHWGSPGSRAGQGGGCRQSKIPAFKTQFPAVQFPGAAIAKNWELGSLQSEFKAQLRAGAGLKPSIPALETRSLRPQCQQLVPAEALMESPSHAHPQLLGLRQSSALAWTHLMPVPLFTFPVCFLGVHPVSKSPSSYKAIGHCIRNHRPPGGPPVK